MQELIQGEAELDDEENDESFDEETGEVRARKARPNGGLEDDSSEEEGDEDEEAAAAVCPLTHPLTCNADPELGSRRLYYRRRR